MWSYHKYNALMRSYHKYNALIYEAKHKISYENKVKIHLFSRFLHPSFSDRHQPAQLQCSSTDRFQLETKRKKETMKIYGKFVSKRYKNLSIVSLSLKYTSQNIKNSPNGSVWKSSAKKLSVSTDSRTNRPKSVKTVKFSQPENS